jgi:hypothetical protein
MRVKGERWWGFESVAVLCCLRVPTPVVPTSIDDYLSVEVRRTQHFGSMCSKHFGRTDGGAARLTLI